MVMEQDDEFGVDKVGEEGGGGDVVGNEFEGGVVDSEGGGGLGGVLWWLIGWGGSVHIAG